MTPCSIAVKALSELNNYTVHFDVSNYMSCKFNHVSCWKCQNITIHYIVNDMQIVPSVRMRRDTIMRPYLIYGSV